MMRNNGSTPPCQTSWLFGGCLDCNDHVAFTSVLLERTILRTAKFSEHPKGCRCHGGGMLRIQELSQSNFTHQAPIDLSHFLQHGSDPEWSLAWHDMVVLIQYIQSMLICWLWYIGKHACITHVNMFQRVSEGLRSRKSFQRRNQRPTRDAESSILHTWAPYYNRN